MQTLDFICEIGGGFEIKRKWRIAAITENAGEARADREKIARERLPERHRTKHDRRRVVVSWKDERELFVEFQFLFVKKSDSRG